MSDSMVERVARAMADQDAMGATADGPGIHRSGWKAYLPMARAAIKAMRELTETMIAAGDAAPREEFAPANKADVWRAMIDEALKD